MREAFFRVTESSRRQYVCRGDSGRLWLRRHGGRLLGVADSVMGDDVGFDEVADGLVERRVRKSASINPRGDDARVVVNQ